MLALALLGTAPTASAQPAESDFIAARNAYERGDRLRLEALAAGFSGHVLEPYVAYWQLKLRLPTAYRDEVRAYWERWPDTPLTDRLRVDWLKTAGLRRDWTSFALDYPPASGEDTELACFGAQYRRAREGDAALVAARTLWFTGNATPESCEPVFTAMIATGVLTVADRRARFRLAVEAGNVKVAQAIAAEMPPDARINPREFAHVDTDPGRALAKGEFAWKRQGGRDLALYALERAARSDATEARTAWEKQRGNLSEADRRYGNARLAFHAARQLAPQANDWFREAAGATLNDTQHAWRVRAALRAGAWGDTLTAIDAMPATQAQEAAWRYWKARALSAAGRDEEANALYATLAQEFNFYGFLAADAIGRIANPKVRRVTETPMAPPTPAQLAAFGMQPGAQRAVKLASLDMRPESLREWSYVIRGLDDDALLVAAEYARSKGLYDRAINTAERTVARHDFGLRYMTPYREQFAAAAREQAVDEAMLFSLARQESRFALDIISSAGAMGLMQLMPPTAKWVAKQLGRSDYRPAQIGDIGVNTQFGAFYFKYCLDKLERMPALAAAAYNAGPSRAQAWRAGAPLEGAIWVETIPFNETRDYVKKVLSNAMFYARELDQPYVPLSARLGTVTPRGGALPGDVVSAAAARPVLPN